MRRKIQRAPGLGRALLSPFAPFASFALLAGLAAFGCAPVPRPAVLAEVDQVRGGAAATEAKTHAPSAFAHAEKLRREADAAFANGDTAGSQLLGERALAAYAHAQVLARIARAEASAAQASAATSAATSQLSSIDADQARVTAELSAIELRVKVAQDAQPVVPSGPADPAREKARLAAARSLALQAKLLCSAARLLYPPPSSSGEAAPAAPPAQPAAPASPTAPAQVRAQSIAIQLDEATTAVTKLESDLATAAAAPIDQASRVRAACLSVLTNIRRAATPVARAPGAGDALLAELSAAGSWAPSRDDRGVTVTLRGLFKGDALTPPGAARLTELGRIAAAHPAFPIVVVVHLDKEVSPKDKAALAARADRVVRAIKDAAKTARVEPVLAGAAAPVVDPAGEGRARNARVEVVFVTPETF